MRMNRRQTRSRNRQMTRMVNGMMILKRIPFNMIMQENRTIAVRRQLRIRMMTGIRREHSSR